MRPSDLWLPHERFSVPATATWNWDLRPLEGGLPAVVFRRPQPSLPCQNSGVEMEAWKADTSGFADAAIVDEVFRRVSDDSTCERGTLLCAPHVGALCALDVAGGKLLDGMDKGWCSQLIALPCWPLRSSPYSVVDESVQRGSRSSG